MYKFIAFSCLILFISLLFSCEKEFTPQTTFEEPELVVEGYIQSGNGALPPYVILTRSLEYNRTIGQDILNNLFVHDATVTISDGTNSAQLQELCVSDLSFLPPFLQAAIANAIGIPEEAFSGQGLDFCVYADLVGILSNSGINPQEGGTYDLTIETTEFGIATAKTSIPPAVALDSITANDHPNFPINDTLVELYGHFQDKPGPNYYRIFSQRNSEAMYPATSRGSNGSVTDDKIFDGQYFEFNIVRGQNSFEEFDFDTFGFFERGDTITIRTSSLDYGHFRFFQTLEANSASQGPFGTYVRVESNITGGLGVWGGASFTEITKIIPQ